MEGHPAVRIPDDSSKLAPVDEKKRLSISSDEGSQPMQVVFEENTHQRRKSSLDPSNPAHQRPHVGRGNTACFVHQMIEGHQKTHLHKISNSGALQDRPSDKIHEPITENDRDQQNTHSRLLTKKQLSDMAFGIRQMSKKLAHLKLLLEIKTVFLLTKAHDETLLGHTREMTRWLLSPNRGTEFTVYVENTLKDNEIFDASGLAKLEPGATTRLKYWDNELCRKRPQMFDVVIALGGDGTVLYASWLFQRVVPPVLTFALGSLGFLTRFDFEQFPTVLSRTFKEGLTVSLRLRFEATIMRSQTRDNAKKQICASRDLVEELIGEECENAHTHRPENTHNILNDIVLDRGPNPTMSSIEVFGDEDHFTTLQADGICIATPTGSTAYNLAAGGSLCHPDNPVILLTAICAHTLSFRPIILPDTMVLRVGVPYDARAPAWASFDGKERVELRPGDYVTISASRFPFPTVLPLDRVKEDWVGAISHTLNWNNRQRQKSFHEWRQKSDQESLVRSQSRET